MAKKEFDRQLMDGVLNPFSDSFLDTWKIWKEYRWQEHKFQYKGLMSEQAALMKLCRLSNGNEEMAVKIVIQSIEGPWSGFFELRENKSNNGKSNSKEQFTREGVNQEANSRTYPEQWN